MSPSDELSSNAVKPFVAMSRDANPHANIECPSGPFYENCEPAPQVPAGSHKLSVSFVEFEGPPRVWIVREQDVIVAV